MDQKKTLPCRSNRLAAPLAIESELVQMTWMNLKHQRPMLGRTRICKCKQDDQVSQGENRYGVYMVIDICFHDEAKYETASAVWAGR